MGFQRHFNNLKNHLGRAYNRGRRVAFAIDQGMHVGKKVLSALSPYLDKMAPEALTQGVKAINSYEQIRNRVMNAHDVGATMAHDVRRSVPELGL